MTDMPEKIAAWRFSTDKADEWVHGGWSEDHDHKTISYIPEALAQAMLASAREEGKQAGLQKAVEVCTNVIKDYDVMEPGKPDRYASIKTQRTAKGMVSLARQEIRAIIAKAKGEK